MKKIFSLAIIFTALFALAACNGETSNTEEVDQNEVGNQLATSVYMSTGLLEGSNATASTQVIFLSTTYNFQPLSTNEEVEGRVDMMLQYFDRVNVFIDGAPEDELNIEVTESAMEGYESQVSYELDGTTYTIYYNVVEASEDDELDENEFTLEGVLEYGSMSFEITGGTEVEEGELEMWFETAETDSDDFVRVEIEKEETEEYFEIESSLNGVESYSEIRLEVDGKDGAIEIYIENGGVETEYEIEKEVDGEDTIYSFEYTVGTVSGSITLTVNTNEQNQEVRTFLIEEGETIIQFTEVDGERTYTNPDDL